MASGDRSCASLAKTASPAPHNAGRHRREETRRKKLEIRNGEWERGRGKPNHEAAALVLLVRRYPDTLERLEKVTAG